MKFTILIIFILIIFCFGFYFGKSGSSNKVESTVSRDNQSLGLDIVDSPNKQNIIIDTKSTGAISIKSVFPSTYKYDSFEDVYSEFKSSISIIEGILTQGDIQSIYGNGGIDVFIGPAYLCHIIDISSTENQLKQKMKSSSGLLFISGDDTFGGKENIQNYNLIIQQYYDTDDNYSAFYDKYLKNFITLMASENISPDVKNLGGVIGGIYALGNDKFVDQKNINCYDYLKKNFSNIRSNK